MPRLQPKDRAKFVAYVRDAEHCTENLAFLLDNLGDNCVLDGSVASLESAEALFWKHADGGIPRELSSAEQFAGLLGQYLGRCVIEQTSGAWVQSADNNPMFGQPCLDGFGGEKWDRIYPVEVARRLRNLPRTKPDFPGVRERRVFATLLEKAIRLHQRANKSEPQQE